MADQVRFSTATLSRRDFLAAVPEQGDPFRGRQGLERLRKSIQSRTFRAFRRPGGLGPVAILPANQPGLGEGGECPSWISPAPASLQSPGCSPGTQPGGLKILHCPIPSIAFQSSQNLGRVLATQPGLRNTPPQRRAPTAAAKAMRWSLRGSNGGRSSEQTPGRIFKV